MHCCTRRVIEQEPAVSQPARAPIAGRNPAGLYHPNRAHRLGMSRLYLHDPHALPYLVTYRRAGADLRVRGFGGKSHQKLFQGVVRDVTGLRGLDDQLTIHYLRLDFGVLVPLEMGMSEAGVFETAVPTFNARHSPRHFGLKKGVVAYTLVANHVPVNAI